MATEEKGRSGVTRHRFESRNRTISAKSDGKLWTLTRRTVRPRVESQFRPTYTLGGTDRRNRPVRAARPLRTRQSRSRRSSPGRSSRPPPAIRSGSHAADVPTPKTTIIVGRQPFAGSHSLTMSSPLSLPDVRRRENNPADARANQIFPRPRSDRDPCAENIAPVSVIADRRCGWPQRSRATAAHRFLTTRCR
jgi:hypothetical protein